MQTTVEETAKHRVRLTVEVPPEEFGKDLDAAYRRIAAQVSIPGFRKGKVPRRVIDAKVGREAVLEEFLSDAVPAYYERAVRERELAPIADPDISLEQVEEGKPLVFTAEVEVRPRLTLQDYRGIRVERPSTEVSDAEVEEMLDRLRERFAELEVVGRPARRGDYVIADIRAQVHDEEVPEATRPGYLYEVGSGEFGPNLDQELEGKRAGEILRFNQLLPEGFGERSGQEVSFTVLVKEVKAKKLPPADDDFARTASEFDTIEELRADLREKLRRAKEREAEHVVRDRVLEELVRRVDVDLPGSLVNEETERRVRAAEERARRAGLTIDQVLRSQGWDLLRFRSDARAHAVRAIKADLVLEAVARQEGIEVTAEEVGREIAALAASLGREPKEVAEMLDRSGQVVSLAGDIIRSKALDLLVEHAEIGPEGETPAGPGGAAEDHTPSDETPPEAEP
ncbi:MAG TPA: trigger factor [Actinomycetota bacterium]|nr:trigger factor [Actinomycetota bacterium]